MSNLDIFTMSLRNLFKRKLRTFLTVLGVVIATASIVVMVSLGLAMNAKFDDEIEKMGDVTIVTVYGNVGYSTVSGSQMKVPPLDDNAVRSFRQLPGVKAASGRMTASLHFKSGKYMLPYATVYGIDPESMDDFGYVASDGRLLEAGDKYNVVFGAKTELMFYKDGLYEDRFYQDMSGVEVKTYVDVMKDKITMSTNSNYVYGTSEDSEDEEQAVKPINIKVVGLLESKDFNTDIAVYMSLPVLTKLAQQQQKQEQAMMQEYGYFSSNMNNNSNSSSYDTVLVKCVDLKSVKEVRDKIQEIGYYAEMPTAYLDSLQTVSSGLQTLLGAIGAVSIFVAAIGIANTMIMAIYERTKEIGVMKVIGASIGDIRKLFLLEAALIGLIGGIFGILLSLLVSYILNHVSLDLFSVINEMFTEGNVTISLITPWLCGAALAFAALIGLLSGYFPARRAMRLSALAAIRSD
jgi:ABC-type antimicrobial peptide transport system permease subunit